MVGSGVCWQDSAQLLHSICAVGTVVEAADSGSSTSASLLSGVSSCPLPVCVVGSEQLCGLVSCHLTALFLGCTYLCTSVFFCDCRVGSGHLDFSLLRLRREDKSGVVRLLVVSPRRVRLLLAFLLELRLIIVVHIGLRPNLHSRNAS